MSAKETLAGIAAAGYGVVAGFASGPVPDTAVGEALHETTSAFVEAADKTVEPQAEHDKTSEDMRGLDEPDYSDVREAEDDGADLTDHGDGSDMFVDGPDVDGPSGDPGPGMGM